MPLSKKSLLSAVNVAGPRVMKWTLPAASSIIVMVSKPTTRSSLFLIIIWKVPSIFCTTVIVVPADWSVKEPLVLIHIVVRAFFYLNILFQFCFWLIGTESSCAKCSCKRCCGWRSCCDFISTLISAASLCQGFNSQFSNLEIKSMKLKLFLDTKSQNGHRFPKFHLTFF